MLDNVQQINKPRKPVLPQSERNNCLDCPCQHLSRFIASYQQLVKKTGKTLRKREENPPDHSLLLMSMSQLVLLGNHAMVVNRGEVHFVMQL